MKNIFLLTLGLATAFPMISQPTTPAIYPGLPFNKIAPDATIAMTEDGTIINFDTGRKYSYFEQYTNGSGNCISSTGIIVGSQISTEKAALWKDGQWTIFPCAKDLTLSYANGITPDGSRVVGSISPSSYTGNYEGMMIVPCYWDVQPDGTYTDYTVLPHPTKDFTGRPPQYVTAVRVSEDGKTIAGQMKDFSGFVCQPIVYHQADDGSWSYTLLLDDLFHPDGMVLPPDPGEGPQPQDFMTQDEIDEFNRALYFWELFGNEDYSTYPDIYDFMTDQEFAEYYEAELSYVEESEDFYIKLNKIINSVPNFSYNNVLLTSDGSQYVTTDTKGFYDEFTGITEKQYTIYSIDPVTENYTKYPAVDGIDLIASSVADNGTIFAQNNDPNYGIFNGYILPSGENEFMALHEYVAKIDPELGEWMEETMYHYYIAVDPVTWREYTDAAWATGVPYCTPDMKYIALAASNFWDFDSPYTTYGYVISPDMTSVVETIDTTSDADVKILANGEVVVNGEIISLEIYSINGAKVLSLENPSGRIQTDLAKGIYVMRYTDGSGNSSSKKIAIN